MHRLLRHRDNEIGAMVSHRFRQRLQIGALALGRGGQAHAARDAAGGTAEMPRMRLRHHHAPSPGGEAAADIKRLGQPPERDQDGAGHAGVTVHITCSTGRVVSRAAGRMRSGATRRQS